MESLIAAAVRALEAELDQRRPIELDTVFPPHQRPVVTAGSDQPA